MEKSAFCSRKPSVKISEVSDLLVNSSIHSHTTKKQEEQRNNETAKRIFAQSIVTSAVMLSSASCGMPVGYSAILLPQLKFLNDSMKIDDEIGSWIASIHSAATPLGSLVSGVLMERCGRKLALQIASIPLISGWAMIAFSTNHSVLLLGRLVAGFSSGLAAAAGQVFIGETSEPHLRGFLTSVPLASYSFGILLVYALGSFLPWRYVAVASTGLPIVSLIVFFLLPESPTWLVRHGKLEDAKNALTWLRGGNKCKAKEETQHLVDRLEAESQSDGKFSIRNLFKREVIKPLIILNVFNTMQLLSGTYLIVFYAVDILSYLQIGEKKLDHFVVAILTAFVRFVFSIFGCILLAFIGRRTLAITSGLGTALSALFLGTFLHQNCQGFNYIPALFVLIYVASNTLGFLILPGVLLAELFPAKIRGLSGGLTFMLFNSMLFGTSKVFPFVRGAIGISGVFWTFGVASATACVFLYFFLPETKSRSLSDIEDYFQRKGFLWTNGGRKDDETDHFRS
ncbi:unnamed protein product [Phyllotreta striolata]|uniref:Major facilitator superfamily (MFS) profile domain-containing protein n=1 Tax=Phyllotreta striolata TaxID=444603 RepID=A0A9P0DWV7_PHYSR|nr:unnamed protein product [Phyllotreta striolata]